MKVLALYDIHGNIGALEAVLADPRAGACDAVVVGGDAVPDPFCRAVLDHIEAITVPVHLRGNGERETAEAIEAASPPAAEDLASVTAAITARSSARWPRQIPCLPRREKRWRPMRAIRLRVAVPGVQSATPGESSRAP